MSAVCPAGAGRQRCGFTDSALPAQGRAECAAARRIRRAAAYCRCSPECRGEACALAAHASGRKSSGKGGGSRPPSFQLFDPPKRVKPVRAMKFTRLEPRIRFFDYDPRVAALFPAPRPVANSRRRPMGWPVQRACTEAPCPQVRTRRPAAPGQASGAPAAEAQGLALAEVHLAAPDRPSAGPPQEARSRSRRGTRSLRLACLGGDEAKHKLRPKNHLSTE